MKLISTYSTKIKEYSHIFKDTVKLYREAVEFYISLILCEWASFDGLTSKAAVNLAEGLSVVTGGRPAVRYDFGISFYKFPCYLRRAAIADAFGRVSSSQRPAAASRQSRRPGMRSQRCIKATCTRETSSATISSA